jgi:hypothetical protein
MTPAEISHETHADMQNVITKAEYMIKTLRKKYLKATKFPVSMTYEQRTVRKNRWLVTLSVLSKKGSNPPVSMTYFCICETPIGKFVYKPTEPSKKGQYVTMVIKPHFFSRYRERMGLEDTGEKLILSLFYSRQAVMTHQFKRDDGSWGLVVTFDDGFGFGDVLELGKVQIVRTFVPKHMLFDDQLPDFLESKADIETFKKLSEDQKHSNTQRS